MLSLSNHIAKLITVNPRSELHGEEHVPAADLFFEIEGPNTHLNMLHHALRTALFHADDAAGASDMFPADSLSVYRFPQVESFKWDATFSDLALTVHFGVSGEHDVKLPYVTADNFRITPKQGGTVSIRFRVRANPQESDLGKLCAWIQSKVLITVEHMEPEQQELPPADGDGKKSRKKKAREEAEGMFIQ